MKAFAVACSLALALGGCIDAPIPPDLAKRSAMQETQLQELVLLKCGDPSSGVCVLYFRGRTADGARPMVKVVATPNSSAQIYTIVVIEFRRGSAPQLLPSLPDYCQNGISASCVELRSSAVDVDTKRVA